ncbi:response regulator transcription factor [Brevibacillus sp. SYSU BS000544]|uniref:response regulator transcription factor n=1 Tax=Brevibacillus sp. SYSU BS000544 TaxID=3416443 RepID=UPI003CE59A27
MSTAIKVMIIEDDPFWQARLSEDLCLEEDIEVLGVAANGKEAHSQLAGKQADVILVDINLTENHLDGLDVARELSRMTTHSRKPQIIMLTSIDDEDVIVRSFQSGAINFLSKSSYSDILQAIRDAYTGKFSIHSDAASTIVREMQLTVLSQSEKEVYKLKNKGLSKTQISEKLHKSVNTIKTQLKNIKKKLTDER